MRKLVFLFFTIMISCKANAQYTIDSKFKPFTYDEMVAPLLMAQKFQKQSLESLEVLANNTEQVEQFISKEKDPDTWREYANCYNSIIDEYNSILKNGTNQNTRGNFSKLQRQSVSLLTCIKSAYNRRNSLANDQYARLNAVKGLTCDRFYSDISIDEFMNGRTPSVTYQNK